MILSRRRDVIMKKTKVILMLVILCTLTSVCWGQSYWKRSYGGSGNDFAYAITPTLDGNFIVAGSTSSFGNGDREVYLLKINVNGDTLWARTYGGTGYDEAYAITPTSDGNFIVAGYTESFGAGSHDVYLLKIKPNGDTLWTRTYGGIGDDEALAITPTSDGNFIAAGCTSSFGDNYFDVYLIKIKPNGDTLWTKTYGGAYYGGVYNNFALAISPTPDGNFIVAVSSSPFIVLLKITSIGDTLWSKTYKRNWGNVPLSIISTSDGNFIAAGCTSSFGDVSSDIYVIKINPNGDTLWTRTYGETGNYEATTITSTSDGNFIVAGTTSSIGAGNVFLLKIKPSGDTLWTKTYGGTNDGWAYSITPTLDGNFIIAGISNNDVLLLSIIDDRYAYKNTPFTFKIPVPGDSLNHGYTPLKVPPGMKVSLGGTISWIPKTDSVYMDHVEYLVFDDIGNKDTLTFNIFVNSLFHPTGVKPASRFIARKNQPFSITQTSASQIKFNLPSGALSLDIFDMRGRQVQHISPAGSSALWNKTNALGTPVPAGKYFAKIKEGPGYREQGFMVVR
jgi:hypothetical protein